MFKDKKKIALGVSAALAALAMFMGGEVKDGGICISFPTGNEPEASPSASASSEPTPAPAPSASAKPAKDGGK